MGGVEHPASSAFVYGIAFAVSFLTRLTNAVAITVYVAYIFFFLLAKKKILNIIKNAVAFVVGTILPIVPFMIYFALNNALYDMIWGTLIYNIQYALASQVEITLHNIVILLCYSWPSWIYFLLIAISHRKRNLYIYLPNILAILASIYVVVSGNLFLHYYILLAIFIPVNTCALREIYRQENKKVNGGILAYALSVPVIILILSGSISVIQNNWGGYKETDYEKASVSIAALIPDEQKNSVIGYNTGSQFYLFTDIMPCYKYFTLQDWQAGKSQEMIEENVAFYSSQGAEWLVVDGTIEINEIALIIEENYEMVAEQYYDSDSESVLRLYHKSEDNVE